MIYKMFQTCRVSFLRLEDVYPGSWEILLLTLLSSGPINLSQRPYSSLIYVVVVNTLTKNNLQRKVFIWLKFIVQRNQGKNLAAGAVAEAKEECCVLACFSWLLSYFTQPRIICLGTAGSSYIN